MGGEEGEQRVCERYLESRDVGENTARQQPQHGSLAAAAAGLCKGHGEAAAPTLRVGEGCRAPSPRRAHPLAVLGRDPVAPSSPCSCLHPEPCVPVPHTGNLGA